MAAKLLIARRMITYLPSLNIAVRHFTNFNLMELTNTYAPTPFLPPPPAIAASTLPQQLPNVSRKSEKMKNNNCSFQSNRQHIQHVHPKNSIPVDVHDDDISAIQPSPKDSLEFIVIECNPHLKSDFQDLFVDRDLMNWDLSVIVLSQKTISNMSSWSQEVEEEREMLLEKFMEGSSEICQVLHKAGYWADFIDPSSGIPFNGSHTNSTLFETDYRYNKLGFQIEDLGCCKVLKHPLWGSHAYIGSVFTDAPLNHPLLENLMGYAFTDS